MLVLSTRIVLDLFYLLIFHSEKFSTDVCRLPYAVNVNLNLSRGSCFTARVFSTLKHNPTFEKKYGFSELFCLVIIEFYFKKIKKRYF